MSMLLYSLPVLAAVLSCPSIHGPPPESALHSSPSPSAAGQSTPSATTSKNGVHETRLSGHKRYTGRSSDTHY